MLKHLREVLVDKIEEQRTQELYCVIEWENTKAIEIVPQKYIRLPPSQDPEINVTYTIVVGSSKRPGKVLALGAKEHCERFVKTRLPNESRHRIEESSAQRSANSLDELVLVGILAKLINKSQLDDTNDDADIHDAQCSACRMEPIRNVDRYRCLECTSPTYDLCGACFEHRRRTGTHLSGHAMVHFKIPNEVLGIHFNNVDSEVTLSNLKRLDTLRYEQHTGINCDGVCNQKNFTGLRFKCDTCPNYNLCERCAIDKHVCTKNHQKEHPIVLTSHRVMPKIDPDDVEMGDILGSGAFGYVCKAFWRQKNRHVACKVIEITDNSSTSNKFQKSFLLELAAYRELSGRYILRTYGYATRKIQATRTNPAKTQYMILMELMTRGSLQNLLESQPNRLSLRRKLTMSRQIASGMRRIHQHGMIHRDIRPDNILVTEDYIAKIGDMGIARELDPGARQTQIGCLEFMPPEFFRDVDGGHIKYDEKLDVYTYGLTLNQLFTETMHDVFFTPIPEVKLIKKSPVFYNEIISRCLESDSTRRPSAIEIEKTLQFYENAFNDTMLNDSYARLDTKQKDQTFIDFYEKNKSKIQQFIRQNFPQEFIKEIPVKKVLRKEKPPSPDHKQTDDNCLIN